MIDIHSLGVSSAPMLEFSHGNFHCESPESPPLAGTTSTISPISQCNAVHILTKDSVETFSFRPSLAINAYNGPKNLDQK